MTFLIVGVNYDFELLEADIYFNLTLIGDIKDFFKSKPNFPAITNYGEKILTPFAEAKFLVDSEQDGCYALLVSESSYVYVISREDDSYPFPERWERLQYQAMTW